MLNVEFHNVPQLVFTNNLPFIVCRKEAAMAKSVTMEMVKEEIIRLSLVFKHNKSQFSGE